VKLQEPEWAHVGGKLVKWKEASLHIGCEAVTRGLSVYEGLKGYWDEEGAEFGIIAMKRHFERLERSARLLHIPCPVDFDGFETAVHDLTRALIRPDRDMWMRPTLYVVQGHWGENTRAELVVTAFQESKRRPDPMDIGVSSWRRSSDAALPARIKTTANYQVARLARIEGRKNGFGEMVLLNQYDRVAEATGCCILMVRDGTVVTTPPSEGRLESITARIVASLCESLGIPFVERPVERTELLVADEVCLVGTLAELVRVRRIEDFELPAGTPVFDRIADRFWDAVRGTDPHPAVDRSLVDLT
jgi:branched-chain amino acid aminotransferase